MLYQLASCAQNVAEPLLLLIIISSSSLPVVAGDVLARNRRTPALPVVAKPCAAHAPAVHALNTPSRAAPAAASLCVAARTICGVAEGQSKTKQSKYKEKEPGRDRCVCVGEGGSEQSISLTHRWQFRGTPQATAARDSLRRSSSSLARPPRSSPARSCMSPRRLPRAIFASLSSSRNSTESQYKAGQECG